MRIDSRESSWRSLTAFLALILAAIASVWLIGPPAVVPESAPATEFSAERAMKHLEYVAREPHPIGTEAHAGVREYILSELRRLGLTPEVQVTTAASSTVGLVRAAKVRNILARIPGMKSSGAILLSSHYDSVPQSYGASDAGAGVVTLLETARALRESPALRNDVILLFTDAEEEFLLGAAAFLSEYAWVKDVSVALNFEARGSHGPSAMFQTSSENGLLIRALAESVPRPVANSLVSSLSRVLPNDTDMMAMKGAGLSGMDFAYANGLSHYHTPQDSLATIDPRSVQHHGSYALPLALHLGNQDLARVPEESPVYFDWVGRKLTVYPVWVARALAFACLVFFVLVFRRGERRYGLGAKSLLLAIGVYISVLALSVLSVGLLGWAFGSLKDPYLAITHSEWLIWPYLVFGTGVLLILAERFERTRPEGFAFVGACLAWVLLAFWTGILAPGASYAFQWPLLFVLVSALLSLRGRTPLKNVVSRLVLVPAMALIGPLVFTVFTMESGQSPAATAFAWLAFLPLLLPQTRGLEARIKRRVALAFMISGLVAWGAMMPMIRFSVQAPMPSHLVYALDADAGQGFWIVDGAPNPWSAGAVAGDLEERALPFYSPSAVPRLSAIAEKPGGGESRLRPPAVRVLKDESRAGRRTLALRVSSSRGARCVSLWEETGVRGITTLVNGKSPRLSVRFSPEIDKKLWAMMTGGPTRADWKFKYCVLEGKSFDLELSFASTEKPKFRVLDETLGLPVALDPRPEGLSPDMWSDKTFVGSAVKL